MRMVVLGALVGYIAKRACVVRAIGARHDHLFLLCVYARFAPYQVYPLLGLLLCVTS